MTLSFLGNMGMDADESPYKEGPHSYTWRLV